MLDVNGPTVVTEAELDRNYRNACVMLPILEANTTNSTLFSVLDIEG